MKKIFKPRARLLLQLGDKLIKNENIAIIELVKNSYDADARLCSLIFNHIDDKKKGEIIIEDNGVGMTTEVVENVWLEPGADFKDLLIQNGNQYSFGFTSDTTIRPPIGEKGVGRFGVHKLGEVIEMVTKSALSNNEIVVHIDWRKFEKEKYLEDAKFDVTERKPEVFLDGRTGTRLSITNLRKEWTKDMFKDLTRSLNSLNSPFSFSDEGKKDYDIFKVETHLLLDNQEIEKEWTSEILDIKDIQEKALWRLEAEIEGNSITKFDFDFLPYSSMEKLSNRKITLNDMKMVDESNRLLLEDQLDLSKFKIGKIKIIAYVFDLGAKIIKLGNQEPKALKDYLSQNGGVRVYRDGLRVYDYGEQGNDWLELDRKRINTPSQVIGNKNILAVVELDRSSSYDLIEKTNREGFTENEAYREFKKSLEQVIDILTNERNIDKIMIRELYEGASKREPVNAEIDALQDIVSEKFTKDVIEGEDKDNLRDSIIEGLNKIKAQYQETNDLLLKSAGAGLSLGVVLHEIEKRIRFLYTGLKEDTLSDLSIIRDSVNGILNMIEGYAKVISSNNKKDISVTALLNKAIFNSEFRFKAHKIELIKDYQEAQEELKISCVENIMIGVLLNIFDNSIYWLDKYMIKSKELFITVKNYPDNKIGIIIADNGKGFSLDPELAIKPFITKKIGGIGLGLYIVDEMMKSVNSSLVIRNYSEMTDKSVPNEFAEGAIIELIFPKV